jgi:phage tail sheath protein FI
MATYLTPGVYIEEISTLPPSVAAVSTAIPAFIGCTENGPTPGEKGNIIPVVARINTMLDFITQFGQPYPDSFTVKTQAVAGTTPVRSEVQSITRDTPNFNYLLYYNLNMYFNNGGGSCYVVSIGNYLNAPAKRNFENGLAALEKEDEPTLIMLTDAVNLAPADYYDLCQQALAQCQKLGDRFTILDVLNNPGNVQEFRDNIGTNNLLYGAAYYPYLQTTLTYLYLEAQVKLAISDISNTFQKAFGDQGITVSYSGTPSDSPKVTIAVGSNAGDITFNLAGNTLTINTDATKSGADIVNAWNSATDVKGKGFNIIQNGDGSSKPAATKNTSLDLVNIPTTLAAIKSSDTTLYNQVKTIMNQQRVVLPPSAAIAGVYASVDRDRGVWKAPANVSLSSVIGPVVKITTDDQEKLNIDPTAGKSINAIRAFSGKGTLVWGARTLAGNDNEWRYISVRRLFTMIEESAQKATAFAVFEPNDAATWLKVRAMIESFLYGLWGQGALAGSTPDGAYFVNVGLGKTMTPQDVLEGRMIVEIGLAAVRPAEFIIIRFSHKMQQA